MRVVIGLAVCVAATPPRVAGALSFGLEPVASGFSRIVSVVGGPDGRLYVLEQDGIIRIVEPDGTAHPAPFLDISDRVESSPGTGAGLLGLALHPDFPLNGTLFVNYVFAGPVHNLSRISRFEVGADPAVADRDSEAVLLTMDQVEGAHFGGHILFGPDGYLYIPMGYGGAGGDPGDVAQNDAVLLGKVSRIDVDSGVGAAPDCVGAGDGGYTIPGNPRADGPGGVCDEIWATGFRNPWRSSFDRGTGDLFVADVGEDAWEEVNHQPATSLGGENYGWRCFEGNHEFNTANCGPPGNYTFPVFEYAHVDNGCSVIGGYVYRGTQIADLFGRYLLTDFCSGTFWDLAPDAMGGWNATRHTHLQVFGFTAFAEAADGELYLVNRDGTLYRIIDGAQGGTAAIGDFVWDDLNGDGIQDPGEPGRSGVTVRLKDCGGALMGIAVSDVAGTYQFSELRADDYQIEVVRPFGMGLSPQRRGARRGLDSDPDPATGLTRCVSLAAGQDKRGIDAGLTAQSGARIGDFVWDDLNGDGIQDPGEAGVAGVSVTLLDCGDNVLSATATDVSGHYLFTGLPAGGYVVAFALPAGLVLSPRHQGDKRGRDSDPSPASGATGCLNLADGQNKLGVDAGLTMSALSAAIGDLVWEDLNRDGIQDAGEPGLVGVTVRLQDCAGLPLQTAATDATGGFLFRDLSAGEYRLEFEAPAGLTFSPPRQGTRRGKDSDADPGSGATRCVGLPAGASKRGVDAGLHR